MDILKTFDLFWTLPEKLFGNKVFRIFHIETSSKIESENMLQAEVGKDEIQLNVYNNQKVYSLLTSVLYKKKKLNENKIGRIYKKCS